MCPLGQDIFLYKGEGGVLEGAIKNAGLLRP